MIATPPPPCAPESTMGRSVVWLRLWLLALLTGVTLVAACLGHPVGGASHPPAAYKLAAHAQPLQRSGAAPSGSRSARGDASGTAVSGERRAATHGNAHSTDPREGSDARLVVEPEVAGAADPAPMYVASHVGGLPRAVAADVAARSLTDWLTPPSHAPPTPA